MIENILKFNVAALAKGATMSVAVIKECARCEHWEMAEGNPFYGKCDELVICEHSQLGVKTCLQHRRAALDSLQLFGLDVIYTPCDFMCVHFSARYP